MITKVSPKRIRLRLELIFEEGSILLMWLRLSWRMSSSRKQAGHNTEDRSSSRSEGNKPGLINPINTEVNRDKASPAMVRVDRIAIIMEMPRKITEVKIEKVAQAVIIGRIGIESIKGIAPMVGIPKNRTLVLKSCV